MDFTHLSAGQGSMIKNGSNEANQLKVGMKKHGNKLTYFTISQLIIVDNENKILALNFNVHSTHLQFIKN